MNFNMYNSVYGTEYFLDSLIAGKSLKLVDNISIHFNHEHYIIFC